MEYTGKLYVYRQMTSLAMDEYDYENACSSMETLLITSSPLSEEEVKELDAKLIGIVEGVLAGEAANELLQKGHIA